MKFHRALGLLGIAAVALAASRLSADDPDASKRVLFVVTSHDRKGDTGEPTGFYLSEVTHPYAVLTNAGYTIDFVSPKGGKAPVDGMNLKDPTNQAFWENPETRSLVENTKTPEEVRAEDYAAIFFAGGHGTMWDFPDNEKLAALAGEIHDRGGVVAAVCHGPAGLVNVKLADGSYLVSGREVAAFTNSEETSVGLAEVVPFLLADKLTERGAVLKPAPNFQAQVVVSDRLVTGQNPASAQGVGRAMVDLLANSH